MPKIPPRTSPRATRRGVCNTRNMTRRRLCRPILRCARSVHESSLRTAAAHGQQVSRRAARRTAAARRAAFTPSDFGSTAQAPRAQLKHREHSSAALRALHARDSSPF
jgi:hypothetical protein